MEVFPDTAQHARVGGAQQLPSGGGPLAVSLVCLNVVHPHDGRVTDVNAILLRSIAGIQGK